MKLKKIHKIRLLLTQAWVVGLIVPIMMGLITEPETPLHIGLYILMCITTGCLYGMTTCKWLDKVENKEKVNDRKDC